MTTNKLILYRKATWKKNFYNNDKENGNDNDNNNTNDYDDIDNNNVNLNLSNNDNDINHIYLGYALGEYISEPLSSGR